MESLADFLKTYFSPLVSVAALTFSVISFRIARRATLYSDIDGKYLELLKLGIANPEFTDINSTRNYKESFKGKDLLKYERYAFAVWNIVETIFDRRDDKKLFATWRPVIIEENRLHREWLNQPENQHKFKNDFWKFLVGNKAFPCPECEETKDAALCKRCDYLKARAEGEEGMPLAPAEQPAAARSLTERSGGEDTSEGSGSSRQGG